MLPGRVKIVRVPRYDSPSRPPERAGLVRLVAWALAAAAIGLALGRIPVRAAYQQEASTPHWIWHRGDADQSFPAETRYFRKAFRVKEESRLVLDVTADNAYVLYLDGKPVAEGRDWALTERVEAKLGVGPHVLAARASNEAPGPAGLLVRGGILPLGQGVPIQTNATWRSTDRVPDGDGWTRVDFDDRGWGRALDLGALGTGPWGTPTFGVNDPAERFRVPTGFTCRTAATPRVTGSVVAFTFDPGGRPCVSIEGGPIARLFDDDGDGRFDRREPITTSMTNCQGLSFVRDILYAVGNGPQGAGLYRLSNAGPDGVFRKTEVIRLSVGGMGEHGPHAIAPGPDGRLYYDNGNHAHLRSPIDPASPVNLSYEGELLPHYNDSRGHAAGIMAPGGEIYRSDDEGKTWKRVVAGFRNQYDFAFNRDGELFTFDSDMEWDVGLPWYRPVRVNHCPLGAVFGWRNGSGKWPSYYADSLPAPLDMGRGSPTGVTFYQASQFPEDYHDRMLICDWSQGRILAVKFERDGASYRASADELVTGQPLNCTDIETGPDGSVYFSTGGRGTQGGLYRVTWGQTTTRSGGSRFASPLDEAIGIDSPLSGFARRRIEELHHVHGEGLEAGLREVSLGSAKRPTRDRVRALDLLFQFGRADEALLIKLANDGDAMVRGRAVALLGLLSSDPVIAQLVVAVSDQDPFVRRHACEGLMQQPAAQIPVEPLLALLDSPDRWLRFAARTAIEHADLATHRDRLLALPTPRARVEGMLALVRGTKLDQAAQDDFLGRQIVLLEEKPETEVEVALLRLIELTYLLGPRKADAAASVRLRPLLLERFDAAADSPANREMARLLAFLDEPRAVAAIVAHQATVPSRPAQIHDAYCLRAMKQGWTPETKAKLWAWYEAASHWEGGFSFLGYLDYMIQELIDRLGPDERARFLAAGETAPFPTRILVRGLTLGGDTQVAATLASLYRRLLAVSKAGPHADDLRGVILEKLGRSRSREAHAALRELYEIDPARRDQIARALADHPTEEDVPLLAAALGSRDPNTTSLAASALLKLNGSPRGPGGLTNLLRLARRLGPSSRSTLDQLAARWTGTPGPASSVGFEEALAAWESVYRKRFPNAPSLGSAEVPGAHAYDLSMLIDNVLRGGVSKTASSQRGAQVILKARCLDCHKLGDKGAGLGPDLTTLNSRFRPAEILESMVLPSKVVSDQYRSVSVATQDGKIYNGMPIVTDGPNLVLLISDGSKVTIPKAEIEEQKALTTSIMPEGLLNPLSYQEIADLLALFESMPRVEAPVAPARGSK